MLRSLPIALIVVRVKDVDDEVDVQIELQFLRHEVPSKHLLRDQHLPGLEELVLLATVEGGAERA